MTHLRQQLFNWGIIIVVVGAIASASWVYGRQTASTFCSSQTTLETLIECINTSMPARDSEAFVVPTNEAMADWQTTIEQMLIGHCTGIILPSSLSPIFEIREFTDSDNSQIYCILLEIADGDMNNIVDYGWGTFIVNTQRHRPLSIQIAHPKFDLGTRAQGITIFKQTQAHSFLMAGAHRNANSVVSSCQAAYEIADASHNTQILFHTAVEAIANYDQQRGIETTSLQFHSMSAISCPGVSVYLTYGRNQSVAANEKLIGLQSNLKAQNPTWVVTIPGETPACGLHGNLNVQARLLNGVDSANACTTSASAYSGRFIHIEQDICCRNAENWITAIINTWSTLYLPFIANN